MHKALNPLVLHYINLHEMHVRVSGADISMHPAAELSHAIVCLLGIERETDWRIFEDGISLLAGDFAFAVVSGKMRIEEAVHQFITTAEDLVERYLKAAPGFKGNSIGQKWEFIRHYIEEEAEPTIRIRGFQ